MPSFSEDVLDIGADNSTAIDGSNMLFGNGSDHAAATSCFGLQTREEQSSFHLGAKIFVVVFNFLPIPALVGFCRMMYR